MVGDRARRDRARGVAPKAGIVGLGFVDAARAAGLAHGLVSVLPDGTVVRMTRTRNVRACRYVFGIC